MKKYLMFCLIATLSLGMASAAGALTATVYLDEAAWAAQLKGAYALETFDDGLLDPGVSLVSEENGHIVVNGNTGEGYYQDVLASHSGNHPQTTFSFSPKIVAYGGYWTLGGPGGSGNSLIVSVADSGQQVGVINNDFNGDFWGFIADVPFTGVILRGGTGSNQQNYKLDDMVYSFVPVPATLYFFGLGLAGLLGLRRISRN